jgi:phosphate transport system ATP-binding protein
MVGTTKFNIINLNVWFGPMQSLKDLTIQVRSNEILSVIGPANSGKTTFLRMLDRLNELQPDFKMFGTVEFDNKDVMLMDVGLLRRKVGMVFALPLPLPLSIFDNIAFGARMLGIRNKKRLDGIVEDSLKAAYSLR